MDYDTANVFYVHNVSNKIEKISPTYASDQRMIEAGFILVARNYAMFTSSHFNSCWWNKLNF